MNILNFFHNIINTVFLIMLKNGSAPGRIKLLLTYLRITLKFVTLNNIIKIKPGIETIFGYKIKILNYLGFYRLFTDIFILKDYHIGNLDKGFIIDCGSNIGMSILFLKLYYPDSKILSFEPDEKVFAILKNNLETNNIKNVDLVNAGLYNREGKIKFYSSAEEDGALGSTMTKGLFEHDIEIKEKEVTAVKLSKYVNEPVDLLKMDIEGVEYVVLKDLSETGKLRFIKEIVMEYHYSNNNVENDLTSILNLLKDGGFRFVINSQMTPPYFMYKNKPFTLILYAYRYN